MKGKSKLPFLVPLKFTINFFEIGIVNYYNLNHNSHQHNFE